LSRRLNQTIRNSSFNVKKDHYARSEILMTRELAQQEESNRDAVEERQRQLAEIAATVWTFPEIGE